MKNKQSISNAINRLFERAPYFSINALRESLPEYKPDTVKSYLSRQKKAGKIFDAGRGWYSSIAEPYRLDTAPVKKLVGELKTAFPLLEFACWSTAQLNDLLRHQLAKHVQFAYVERDAIDSVAAWLRENGYRPWANPGKKERKSTNSSFLKKVELVDFRAKNVPIAGKVLHEAVLCGQGRVSRTSNGIQAERSR